MYTGAQSTISHPSSKKAEAGAETASYLEWKGMNGIKAIR